jgi:hippurate hydrolase
MKFDADLSEFSYLEAAKTFVGKENISGAQGACHGIRKISRACRAPNCRVGHSGTTGLHNPTFLDRNLPVGASIMARIASDRLTA